MSSAPATSGASMQPWHFGAVSDPEIQRRIRSAAEEGGRAFCSARATNEGLEGGVGVERAEGKTPWRSQNPG